MRFSTRLSCAALAALSVFGPLSGGRADSPTPHPAPKPVTSRVVQGATSLRGTRYRMGGTSRSGFDCSGFVRYVLSHEAGVALPRTAVEQYYHGQAVAAKDLQPGDLVFFKNTYKHGISHVGIYTGNGQFIHAANAHKGVRLDSLNTAYYRSHFAGARRVLPIHSAQAAAPVTVETVSETR